MPGRGRLGFTVLEGLVAMALVVTALLTLLSVFLLSDRHARANRDDILARTVANSAQDELLARGLGDTRMPCDWELLSGKTGYQRVYRMPVHVEGRAAAPLEYRVEATPGVAGDGGYFSNKSNEMSDQVHVLVSWTGPKGRPKRLEFDLTVSAR